MRGIAIPVEVITERIFIVRGHKVILDTDLAALYDTTLSQFNQAVKRNRSKFPVDFMFQLTSAEWDSLRSQFVILKTGRGQHRKFLPYVFTEHGAIMAASLLSSPRAVEVSVYVVRAFVQQRALLASSQELAKRLRTVEQRIDKKLVNHDKAIAGLIDTLHQLMAPEASMKQPMGFVNQSAIKRQRAKR